MVARAISQSKSTFHGARPFNPATDLNAVAHLLEESFRADHSFPLANIPVLRELGVVLWILGYVPQLGDRIEGFVWVEAGQIVGNVTLSADYRRSDQYYISNVAVSRKYRRQGIARALMQTTIDHIRQQQAHKVLLNVRPNNPGAIKLYEDLGFKSQELRGEWELALAPWKITPKVLPGLRPLTAGDRRQASELVQRTNPPNVQQYPLQSNEFELALDEQLVEVFQDVFTGQVTRRWILERERRLAALVCVRGQRLGGSHRIAIRVHPDFRGQVEDELVQTSLGWLSQFPTRKVRAQVTGTHLELVAELERYGFRLLNGLTLMELVL